MRINREIRADKVRVISETGEQLGIISLAEALARAEKLGLDLVEISPSAKPPVAKIIDYGKFRYLQQKKEKDSRKAQIQIKVKEIKLKPNIDTHDFNTKVNNARKFLLDACKVRVTCMFRGREMLHLDLGEKVIQQFCLELSDVAALEAPPRLMGRAMSTMLAPNAKKIKQKRANEGETGRAQDEN